MIWFIDRVAAALKFAGLPPLTNARYDPTQGRNPNAFISGRVGLAVAALEDHYGITEAHEPDAIRKQMGVRLADIELLQQEVMAV